MSLSHHKHLSLITMFELNKNLQVHTEKFFHTNLYVIEDFYKDPDEVKSFLCRTKPPLWKSSEKNQNNGKFFEDRRFNGHDADLIDAYTYLSKLCNQIPVGPSDWVVSNMTKFLDKSYNKYNTCYWWPHFDYGYNGIVYLNDDSDNGTNIYDLTNPNEIHNRPDEEHLDPWRNKNNYRVVKTIVPKYNRMVLFDGMFPHGMNITTDKFFGDEYRINQVFFFKNDD